MFCLLGLLAFAACGGGGREPESAEATTRQPKPLFQFSRLRHPELEPAFGQWTAPCETDSRHSGSMRVSLTIDDDQIVRTDREFEDPACQDPNLFFVTTFDIVKLAAQSLRRGVNSIELATRVVWVQLRITPRYARIADLRRLCGVVGWVDGEQRRVDGASCPPYATPPTGMPRPQTIEVGGGTLSLEGRDFIR